MLQILSNQFQDLDCRKNHGTVEYTEKNLLQIYKDFFFKKNPSKRNKIQKAQKLMVLKASDLLDYFFDFTSSIESKLQSRMGYIYSLLAIFVGLFVSVVIKALPDFNTIQLIALRGCLTFGFIVPIMSQQNIPLAIDSPKINRILILRGILCFISMPLNVYAVLVLSIGEFAVIYMLCPPIIGVLCWIFLGESLTKTDIYSSIISFAGVLCIVKPGLFLIFGDIIESGSGNVDPQTQFIGEICLIVSVLLDSTTSMMLRQLGPSVHSASMTAYFNFFIGPFMYLLVITSGNITSASAQDWIMIAGYSFCGLLYQIFMARAYAFEKASKVALVQYLNIIFSFMMDVFFYGASIHIYQIVGIILIFTTFGINLAKDFQTVDRQRTSTVYSVKGKAFKYGSLNRDDKENRSFHFKFKQFYGHFASVAIRRDTALRGSL